MESQLKHPEQHTNLDHEHGEKQSILKKVKAKAKKIKDSIKKHGHHHGHDEQPHENCPEFHHEEDDDEDEYEEMEKDPEVHDAPVYESQVARNPNVGLGGNQGLMHQTERHGEPAEGKDRTTFGIPESHGLMPHQPNFERTDEPAVGKDHAKIGVPTSQGLMHQQPYLERMDEPAVGKDHTRLGVPTSHGLMHHHPNLERTYEPAVGKDHTMLGVPTGHGMMHHQPGLERTDEPAVGKEHSRLGVPTSHGPEWATPELQKIPEMSREEDLGAPKCTLEEGPWSVNYEAKVGGPAGAGAEETPGIRPLLHSLDKMSVNKPAATGSRDQAKSLDKMSADKLSTGSHDQLAGQPTRYRDIPDDLPLITGEAVELDLGLQGGSYGEKLAYATAVLADKVVAAKDAAAAKLGYGDVKIGGPDDQSHQTSQTSYTDKASQAASLLAGKAVGVKDAVASKLGYGETEEHNTPREPVDHEALMHQQQQQQTGYIEKASDVTSALADKAVRAKNVVASKLGYGGTEEHKTPREPVDHEALMQQQQSGYMVKVAGVTSTLADKAVEAKNVVASKLGYDQTGDDTVSANTTRPDQTGASTVVDKAAQVKNAVASKPGYSEEGGPHTETSTWAEKLKPGDEDKALSELISYSVCKASPHRDDISAQQEAVESMSKVPETEAVARGFGTGEEEKRGDLTHIPGSESPRKAVVDKIKVAVSSLWSSGDQTLAQYETLKTSNQHEADQSSAGVRRLQESAN